MRRRRGTSLIELVCVLPVIIAVALAILDLSTLVIAASTGDALLKNVVRSASSTQTPDEARQVSVSVMANFNPNAIIQTAVLDKLDYNVQDSGIVQGNLTLVVKLPVSLQGCDVVQLHFSAVEAITGLM